MELSMNAITRNSPQTLTRAVLTEELSKKMGLTRLESEQFIESLFSLVVRALERGEEVKISSFGNFKLIDKPARPGRNPKTLEECVVSARRVVTFKAGNKLKGLIQEQMALSEDENKDEITE